MQDVGIADMKYINKLKIAAKEATTNLLEANAKY